MVFHSFFLFLFCSFALPFKAIIPLSADVSCLDVMEVLNRCDSQATTKITDTAFYSLE